MQACACDRSWLVERWRIAEWRQRVSDQEPFGKCKCKNGEDGYWDPVLEECVPLDDIPETGGKSGGVVIYHVRNML